MIRDAIWSQDTIGEMLKLGVHWHHCFKVAPCPEVAMRLGEVCQAYNNHMAGLNTTYKGVRLSKEDMELMRLKLEKAVLDEFNAIKSDGRHVKLSFFKKVTMYVIDAPYKTVLAEIDPAMAVNFKPVRVV